MLNARERLISNCLVARLFISVCCEYVRDSYVTKTTLNSTKVKLNGVSITGRASMVYVDVLFKHLQFLLLLILLRRLLRSSAVGW